ncbi:hypothetical protein BH11ARM2_BH11ARM2_17660 [soil metagenome]
MSLFSIVSELAYAQALMKEARRHREDASVLAHSNRYAAGIASLHKASEIAIKAWVAVNGGMRYWSNMHATHKPITSLQGGGVWKELATAVESQRSGLLRRVIALEVLESSKPGTYTQTEEQNAEYPFAYFVNNAMYIDSPGDTFDQQDYNPYESTVDELHQAIEDLGPDLK